MYVKLKQQFTVFHKAVEKLRKSEKQPGELKHEITQLEEERAQLKDKIKSLKNKTADLVHKILPLPEPCCCFTPKIFISTARI